VLLAIQSYFTYLNHEEMTTVFADFQVFPATRGPGYIALQGRVDNVVINARVAYAVIDELDTFGVPTQHERVAFARDNRKAIGAIAEKKVLRGEAEHESSALAVQITRADVNEYLSQPGNRFSYAAFDPSLRPKWGRDGRF
jgi:hypothetical protein